MKRFLFVFIVTCILACSNDDDKTEDPVLCTEEARPGLEVTVKDASNNMVLIDDVEVVATDGEYTERLESFSGSDLFLGAYERPGTYTVIVTKSEYQVYTSTPIVVEEDMCHVITESLEVLLEKNQGI